MLISQLIDKYVAQGYSIGNSRNLAAEEIIINKIAKSPLAEHVTLKGGIVMFNLSKSNRRVTQDIDFDLIRYSIEEESIKAFINKLNTVDRDIVVSINGPIEKLHQEDYRGVRVKVKLKDSRGGSIDAKMDIGVHTYTAIEQQNLIFSFDNNGDAISIKANPCEQLFAEKLLALARLGSLSTRYKDIYDLSYLISHNLVKTDEVSKILTLFFNSSKREPKDMTALVNAVIETLEDPLFIKEASNPSSKWLDTDYHTVANTIKSFVNKL